MKIYRLKELKTNQLRKLYLNGNITEDQFNTADKFFKTHNDFEKEIDWNRGLKITWDELEKVIKKERNSKSQSKKKIRKGLEGFEEGKDYLILDEGIYNGESWVAYQPFTWEASRMIASHYVEPSKNEEGDLDDADWCTAYQKSRAYWDNHNKIEAFIYICGESIPTKKVSISISKEGKDASGKKFLYSLDTLNFNIWDFYNYNNTIEESEIIEAVPNLNYLIKRAYKIWDDKAKKYILSKFKLNPQTNKYDYEGALYQEDLKHLVSEDKNGFIINFGEVTGNFNCSELNLISLKGSPQSVGGSFSCYKNHLTSLEGSPQTVGGSFECSHNKLTSLKGASQDVGGGFFCDNNYLTSLEGSPQTLVGSFYCNENQLTSLKGAPQTVGGNFCCFNNPDLHSLEGIGNVIGKVVKDF